MKPAAVDPRATLDALGALDHPDQVRAYKLRTVAAALGVTYETVRGWARRDYLATLPTPPGAARLVALSELQRLAAEGWPVDPAPLIDAD